MSYLNKNNEFSDNKQEVFSITYEEIGFFPRSFSRVLDRFLKQVFSDVENLVIQEYRFYRYLFLTTLKCLLILFFVPFFVHFLTKTYIVRPLTEYFWNTKQTEIFLNSYQQKHAFSELKEFEEKTYFESLIFPKSALTSSGSIAFVLTPSTKESLIVGETVNAILETPDKKMEEGIKTLSLNNLNEEDKKNELEKNNLLFTGNDKKNSNDVSASDSFAKAEAYNLGSNRNEKDIAILSLSQLSQDKLSLQQRTKETNTASNILLEEKGMYEKSSLFVYQTQEADKNIQKRYQEKTIELAQRYNDQSIEAITNFFADLISLLTLIYLLYALEIQINITKSFLLEVFFGLDDSKKSLLILLITDLLVGYHSSNLWELFFEFLFHHYGLPESQTGIFLLVATLPVLLDVLFKYLIFRHLNRSSPATVATYHAMIE